MGPMISAADDTMHESISRCEPHPGANFAVLRMRNLAALTHLDGVVGLETPSRLIGN